MSNTPRDNEKTTADFRLAMLEKLNIIDIVYRIVDELERSKKQHPHWPEDIIHQVSVMCEESGESLRAALNHYYSGDELKKVEDELIQTGAMVIRCLENLKECRNQGPSDTDYLEPGRE